MRPYPGMPPHPGQLASSSSSLVTGGLSSILHGSLMAVPNSEGGVSHACQIRQLGRFASSFYLLIFGQACISWVCFDPVAQFCKRLSHSTQSLTVAGQSAQSRAALVAHDFKALLL